MRVMKFGGSSVGTRERLRHILATIAREHRVEPVAVVVSAMGDTTDWLLDALALAAKGDHAGASTVVDRVETLAIETARFVLDGAQDPGFAAMAAAVIAPLRTLLTGVSLVRERTAQTADLALSFGERLSATLVAAALDARGTPAVFVDAREWTVTDDRFGAALVDVPATKRALGELARHWGSRVAIHTGFIGRTRDGRTTTLGRNGSDYTAALLAQALAARELTVWTDVDGVMTADPSLVADAYPVPRLTQHEALELANLGMRMFHPRTMLPLIEANIPLRIRHTMRPDGQGTVVDAGADADEKRPACVVSLEELALIDVEDNPVAPRAPAGDRVLRALESAGVTVWAATLAPRGRAVSVVVPAAQGEKALATLEHALERDLAQGEVEPLRMRSPVTMVTLVAEAMGRTVNVAGRFFSALGAVGVPVRASAQGASSRSISAVIDAADTTVAVRTVHAAFNLAAQQVSVVLMGKGVVGAEFVRQVHAQATHLAHAHDVSLKIVGVLDSTRALFDERGVDLSQWRAQLEAASVPLETSAVLEKLRRLPVPVLVDCTAADAMERVYREAFSRGIHVVAANKKPLTVAWASQKALRDDARAFHRAYLYETTVGASLPVIDTLNNLVRTGDRVLLIEGALSGTLGFLANEVMRGVPLSRAVRVARERGYTEPHPRDDLSGLDVARKGLILARELGAPLELADVVVEPFVPSELLAHDEIEDFFAALEAHDERFAQTIDALRAEQKVFRYLARVEPAAEGAPSQRATVRVGPVAVAADHPAAGLRGAEAFVAFTTERYREYPLVVRGAGAGGAVTAAGVLADVLRIAQSLRGR